MDEPNGTLPSLPPARRRPTGNQTDWRTSAARNLSQPATSSANSNHRNNTNTQSRNWRHANSDSTARQPPIRARGNYHRSNGNFRGTSNRGQEFAFVPLLEKLANAECFQVVKELAERHDQFDKFVKGSLGLKEFQLLIRVLRKVCESNFDKHKVMIINQSCHPDLMNLFPTMLMSACSEDRAKFGQLARDIVHFFSTLVRMLPITAASLKNAVKCCHLSIVQVSLENPDYVSPDLLEKYETVKRDVEALQTETAAAKPSWLSRRREEVERMKYEQPPNDFREISIYPTFEDVVSPKPPFLRPNVINGPYFDVEHYLDTQFRLLREDFVRPLRQGVQDILHGTDSRKNESLSVRIYQKVKFLEYVRETNGSRVLNEGTLLCFDTSNGNRYRNTNWETTKKFMHGALLCFTKNSFKTLLFATVSSRDVKYLKNRQILVNFQEKPDEDILDPKASYTMIESEVFFEPYFQVLKALQSMNEHNFPFAKYFVDVQKEDQPPRYLLQQDEDSDDVDSEDEQEGQIVEISIKGLTRMHHLIVLAESTWPNASQLGLDNSQYLALKAALTRELAVIQGPPGTGKTFMALKIAEILIRNKRAMRRRTPILVVCLTNHALDQFLVGMLPFTDSLVRIGGQSKCEQLDEFNMRKLRFRHSRALYELQDRLAALYPLIKSAEHKMLYLESALIVKTGICISKSGILPNILDNGVEALIDSESFVQVNDELMFISFDDIQTTINSWKYSVCKAIDEDENLGPDEKNLYKQQVTGDGLYYLSVVEYLRASLMGVDSSIAQQRGDMLMQIWKQGREMDFGNALELYCCILDKKLAELGEQRNELLNTITTLRKRADELRNMDCLNELRDKDVIGLTTNGAARIHTLLNALGCEIVIVEEAAEVMESHIVASVSKRCKHLILIGDHKQLRPKISEYELGKVYNFDMSLFERMVINRAGCITLQVQHRMAPEMAKLIVPTIYKTLENHESVLDRPNLRSLTKRLSFVSHSEPEDQDKENSSRTNPYEAKYLIALCQHLLKQGYTPDQITLLTTYKGQMFLMKSMIRQISNDKLRGVRVIVVDDYQGEESDIILLSLVRSNPQGRIGFLATENRVCVALSRAKQAFVMIGDMDLLSANSSIWKAVRRSIEDQNALDSALTLRCEVHPDYMIKVARPEDFTKLAPHGGCDQICADILNCGHPCNKVCHMKEIPHEEIKCNAPCERLCDAGLHQCSLKCFVKCGSNCMVKVTKELPCGHKASMRCSQDEERFYCQELVTKKFEVCQHEAEVACSAKVCSQPCNLQAPCGHSCTRKCHTESDPDHLEYKCEKNCTKLNKNCRMDHACLKKCSDLCDLCEIEVQVKRSCGHNYKLKCHIDPEALECTKTCNKMLECGHRCLRKCNLSCTPCIQIMEKEIAECGHVAQVPCGRSAERGDCKQKCEKLLPCGHECKAKCAEECTANCREVVEMQTGECGHEIKRFCFEKTKGTNADVMRCTAKCGKTLVCGHECSGSCKGCHQGRFHETCKKKCEKQLVCGHKCKSECGAPCSSCTQQNSVACEHAKLDMKCGTKRAICMKNSNFKCEHMKRDAVCGMYIDHTELCQERCPKMLACEHQCVGFCGAQCPGLCWECDKEELQDAFALETKIPKDPRFILLPDCHHTIEATALLNWFKWQSANVEAKSCPRCAVPISARLKNYKKLVWEAYEDFDKIRMKVKPNNKEFAKELLTSIKAMLIYCRRTGIESLTNYVAELEKVFEKEISTSLQPNKGKGGKGKGQNINFGPSPQFTNDLPMFERKLDVIQSLVTILERNGKTNVQTVQQEVDFLVVKLSNCKTMRTQQSFDFEKLLRQLKSTLMKQHGLLSRLDLLTLHSINLQHGKQKSLLKDHWQKCVECAKLQFGLVKPPAHCNSCDNLLSVNPIEFKEHNPAHLYDARGRLKAETS